ncbi:hypothetical protein [Geotalea toluenoxydans]|nr:hypothetical protein [Geotalea toluenoxydans]
MKRYFFVEHNSRRARIAGQTTAQAVPPVSPRGAPAPGMAEDRWQ